MFERYTEEARRIIFFARYETSSAGLMEITPGHLLLGFLREAPGLIAEFLPNGISLELIRKEMTAAQPPKQKVSTSVDLPISMDAKRVLAYAGDESEKLEHRYIDSIHLLLGLLRDPGMSALLVGYGVTREKVLTHAGVTMPPDTSNAVRHRLMNLVRNLPPQMFAVVEDTVQGLLAARPDVQQRSVDLPSGTATIKTGRNFLGNELLITETVAAGEAPGTVNYSVKVRAFGEERQWQTTFETPNK